MYNQIFLFLPAIFVFSVSPDVETPWLAPLPTLALFATLLTAWTFFCRRQFAGVRRDGAWFRQEKRLTILSLPLYCALVYGCDLRHYLGLLDLGGEAPSVVNILGLAVFFLCLAPVWEAARPSYQRIFAARYSRRGFFWLHCRAHLPIVLPWIALSLASDAVSLLPVPGLHRALASAWGDFLFFFLFVVVIAIFMPPLVRRLWACKALPNGPLRRELAEFCARQGFRDGIFIWPLFEGRMMTAAVMGIVPGLRFILLTPAMIESVSRDELFAVLAHELSHVKHHHLIWYVLLLAAFSALMGALSDPFLHFILPAARLEQLLATTSITPATYITISQSLPILIGLLLFFRFVFGWFMRNFERQADLGVIAMIGDGQALRSTFEQLAATGGDKEQANWHHFGLGERIRAIEAAERDPAYIIRHNQKTRRGLGLYFLVIALLICPLGQANGQHEIAYENAIGSGLLQRQIRLHPQDARPALALADFQARRGLEREARDSYERALNTFPDMVELLNNFAWFLVTSHDVALRDPARALSLARLAVVLHPTGNVYDTLATTYWANGLTDMATETELRAIAANPGRRQEYLRQLARFRIMTYEESLARPAPRPETNP
ncbi:MAG: M48 family metalloprotease [Desulfobulbaceae bacterium]|jgi:Zn-dependent protease with chaperone function|nr:M48 family metalloprotease [Desulfobulbaceae bacterium]